MINEDCKKEFSEFIRKGYNFSVVVVPVLKDGYITCIKPIRGICGAEVHVSKSTLAELKRLNLIY